MGAGLRPKAKGLDKPPDPTVRAPVLDPTLGEGVTVTSPPYPTPRWATALAYPTPEPRPGERLGAVVFLHGNGGNFQVMPWA